MSVQEESIYIPTSNLVPGVYVNLELGWMDHPFPLSRFVVKSEREIATIRQLKPDRVRIHPARGDQAIPLDELMREPVAEDCAASAPDPELEARLAEKRAEQERLAELRARRRVANKEYREKSEQIRRFTAGMKASPATAISEIDGLVGDLTSRFGSGEGVLTQLVDLSASEFSDVHHVTNVTMLSLMLGSAQGLKGESLKRLGMGAMLHDLGHVNVPLALRKKRQRSPAEEAIVQRHAAYGRSLVERVRAMSDDVLAIIERHHEYLDGSGYPQGLAGDAIPTMVRIVSVVDHYDYLCNPPDASQAMTPKSALAMLYRDYRDRLDVRLIAQLVDLLGIYPPGSVVELSGEQVALVIAARAGDKLRPDVLVYDPGVPKQNAVIIRLAEREDISIERALLPGDYPSEIHDYFGIQDRIGYLLGAEER